MGIEYVYVYFRGNIRLWEKSNDQFISKIIFRLELELILVARIRMKFRIIYDTVFFLFILNFFIAKCRIFNYCANKLITMR